MSVPLYRIEQEVAARVGPWASYAASAMGGADTIVVSALASTLDLGGFEDRWVLRRAALAGDRQRRVASYAHLSGTLTVDQAYTTPVGLGELIELVAVDPAQELRPGVLAGLARCFFVDRVDVPVTAGRVEEDLSAALYWVTDVGQVRGVETRTGAAWTNRPADLSWSRPLAAGGGVVLGVPGTAADVYVVEALRPVATWVNGADAPSGPASDADTLDVDLAYAVAAGHVEVWRRARSSLAPIARAGLIDGLPAAAAELTARVRSQWWYWDRPDAVRFRYPVGGEGGYAVTGGTWRAAAALTWSGLSASTWRAVLEG